MKGISVVLGSQNALEGGGPADEDPIPPDGVDPHPIPQHANDFPGFQPLPNHNIHAQNEDWDAWEEQAEQEQHWAFPQPEPFQPQQQQVVIPVLLEEGAPNSSITTTVSIFDGLLSLTHSASEEVNQGIQATQVGQGLLNIALAYNAIEEDEEQVPQNNLENVQQQNPVLEPTLIPPVQYTEPHFDLKVDHMNDGLNVREENVVTDFPV